MAYTNSQRAVLRGQLDAVIQLLNCYDEGMSPSAPVQGLLAAAVLNAGVEQVETLDQARNAAVTALETGLAAWQAAE